MITTEFVRKYQGLVKSVVFDYEKDSQQFEDLTQEIWLHICRKEHLLPIDPAAHSTWIHVLAENVCKHHIRKLGYAPDLIMDSTISPPVSEGLNPDESWIEQAVPSGMTTEDDQLLAELMIRAATMSELETAVFNLVYWDGKSYDTVARTLGVSKDTVGPIVGRLRAKIEARELYHPAYTYHAPGAVWGDWAFKPNGIGNVRMDEENNNNGTTNSSGQDRTSFEQAV